MGRPPKSVEILETEGKSHRTKKELEERQEAENSLLTGIKLRRFPEVKSNETANKEFLRVQKLLQTIGKDDDLYSNIINRYCLLKAECGEFEAKREKFYLQTERLEELYDSGELEGKEYFRLLNQLQRNVIDTDKQIQNKRKMMFDIEKENLMTVASALRSIPKASSKKTDDDELAYFIKSREDT